MARDMQGELITRAQEWPRESWQAQELIELSALWKKNAAYHEANGNRLGGL
jgi:hypothetical protein